MSLSILNSDNKSNDNNKNKFEDFDKQKRNQVELIFDHEYDLNDFDQSKIINYEKNQDSIKIEK